MFSTVTFVVIGKNEGKILPRCFESIEQINDNIIYVDSGSIDNSVEIAKRYGIKKILLIKSNYYSASLARYVGARYANTKYIQFIDGDMSIEEGWIKEAIEAISKTNTAAVLGYKKVYKKNFSDHFVLSDKSIWQPDYLGGAFLIKTEIYRKAGGFDYRFAADEERDLYIRIKSLGNDIWYISKLMASHYDFKQRGIKYIFFGDSTVYLWLAMNKSLRNRNLSNWLFVYRYMIVPLFMDVISTLLILTLNIKLVLCALIIQMLVYFYCNIINRKGFFVIWKAAILNLYKLTKIVRREYDFKVTELA